MLYSVYQGGNSRSGSDWISLDLHQRLHASKDWISESIEISTTENKRSSETRRMSAEYSSILLYVSCCFFCSFVWMLSFVPCKAQHWSTVRVKRSRSTIVSLFLVLSFATVYSAFEISFKTVLALYIFWISHTCYSPPGVYQTEKQKSGGKFHEQFVFCSFTLSSVSCPIYFSQCSLCLSFICLWHEPVKIKDTFLYCSDKSKCTKGRFIKCLGHLNRQVFIYLAPRQWC